MPFHTSISSTIPLKKTWDGSHHDFSSWKLKWKLSHTKGPVHQSAWTNLIQKFIWASNRAVVGSLQLVLLASLDIDVIFDLHQFACCFHVCNYLRDNLKNEVSSVQSSFGRKHHILSRHAGLLCLKLFGCQIQVHRWLTHKTNLVHSGAAAPHLFLPNVYHTWPWGHKTFSCSTQLSI